MFSWLKKYFIPHEGNNHRPHFLRRNSMRNIVILILFVEIFTFFIPTLNYVNRLGTGNMAAVLPGVLSMLSNEERQIQKLPPLIINPLLTKAAELKVQDMASKGYFAHTSPEGVTPWYWFDKVGYDYQSAGENLAIDFTDSIDVTEAWMNSPTHRANIVKGKYTEIGTGIATGLYNGKETIFVAQLYGTPTKPVNVVEKENIQNISTGKVAVVNRVAQIPTNVLGAEKNINKNKF